MSKTVNADETIAPEQGRLFFELFPPCPKCIVQSKRPRGAEIGWVFLRKLLVFSGPGYLVAVGYMIRGTGPQTWPVVSQFYYTLLSVVIISSLMAIFLTN
jgi:hypothetical protein